MISVGDYNKSAKLKKPLMLKNVNKLTILIINNAKNS